jgi:hypothetical protein
MITEVAASRVPRAGGYRDHVRENARRVLTLIGGEGITNLVNRELESDRFWGRHGGLMWAYVRPDPGTVEQLSAIATRPLRRGDNGKPDSDEYQEFYEAMIALGALGADAALVEAVWASGVAQVPAALAELRAFKGPMKKDLTAQAAEVLESNAPVADDRLAAAILIAWLSADGDFIPPLRRILARSEPGSHTAGLACIALRTLGDRSEDFVRLAMALLPTEKNDWIGMNALLSLGEQGSELLGRWLKDRPATARGQHDIAAIRALYESSETRKLAIDLVASRSLQGLSMLDVPYDIAAETNDAGLREQIFDKAFAGRSFITTEPLRAIDGLAKFDTTRAIEAIELALRSHSQIERELCRQLVKLAPEMAAAKFMDVVVDIDRESLRNAVGRALRRLDIATVEPLMIERLSLSSPTRKIVAEIAGWLPSPAIKAALRHLADQDGLSAVQHSAQAALDRHEQEQTARELLAAFPQAGWNQKWALFIALLEVGDPYLLTTRNDPLWLGQILNEDVPEIFAHHAEAELRQRKQKIQ